MNPKCAAWRCVVKASSKVAYRTSTTMADKSDSLCSEGDTFVGTSVTAQDGSAWLHNESNGLFVPVVHPETKTLMFEEMRWQCVHNGSVRGRTTPNVSDQSEVTVQIGQTISAMPVPEHPGWLMDAESKLYFPMNHPNTGVAVFSLVGSGLKTPAIGRSLDVEQGMGSQALKPEDDATCEKVATGLSLCCPIVGCVTFCISAANNKEGSQKRKWGNIACAVGTCSFLAVLVLQVSRMGSL